MSNIPKLQVQAPVTKPRASQLESVIEWRDNNADNHWQNGLSWGDHLAGKSIPGIVGDYDCDDDSVHKAELNDFAQEVTAKAFTLYSASVCGRVGQAPITRESEAKEALALGVSAGIAEALFGADAVADPGTIAGITDVTPSDGGNALALLDEAFSETYPGAGVLWVPAGLLPYVKAYLDEDTQTVKLQGHSFAIIPGKIITELILTPPVLGYRDPEELTIASEQGNAVMGLKDNMLYSIAEQTFAVGFNAKQAVKVAIK